MFSTVTIKVQLHWLTIPNFRMREPRLKHIDVQYPFIREYIEIGIIKLEYYPTKDLVADALTKALPKQRHWITIKEMGLESLQQFRSGSDEISENLCNDD